MVYLPRTLKSNANMSKVSDSLIIIRPLGGIYLAETIEQAMSLWILRLDWVTSLLLSSLLSAR